jgi:putative serine protease PepD
MRRMDASDDATITLPALPPLDPVDTPPTADEPSPPPSPPSEPPAPAPSPTPPRWRRGAAALAAAVIVGGAAGGVAGRVTAPDQPPTVAASTANRGGSGTGSIATLTNIQQVLDRISPAVVSIRTQAFQAGRFFPTGGAGSGTIITADGEVLTNAHVVEGATSIKVTLNGEKTARDADLLGIDTQHDLALVKIRDAKGLPTATLGSSADLRVGDSVVAIGNALDLGSTPSVTEGIVSALNRSISAPGETLTGAIQTDAAINPGNSGGPLVDAQGRVVGMNTAIAGDAQNIGFAIPIDAIKLRVDALRKGSGSSGTSGTQSTTGTGFLGVAVADSASGDGALIQQVASGSPADDGGLQPGDIVSAIGGDSVSSADDLVAAVRGHKPGDKVKVTFERNGTERTATVTLGSSGTAG